MRVFIGGPHLLVAPTRFYSFAGFTRRAIEGLARFAEALGFASIPLPQ
jgi:hypothetical protein